MKDEKLLCEFHRENLAEDDIIMTKIPVPDSIHDGCYIEVALCPECRKIMRDQPEVLRNYFLSYHENTKQKEARLAARRIGD